MLAQTKILRQYTLGTKLLLENINTKQLGFLLDEQLGIFIIVHYIPVAPQSSKIKLWFFYLYLRDCSSTERHSNYICKSSKNLGLPPSYNRSVAELEQQADPLALQTLGCQDAPKPFSCHQGSVLSAGSINQALLMAAGTRTSGICQWQRLAPGKGLGAEGDMATPMGLDS